MNMDQNKTVSRRLIEELFNKGSLNTADELTAPSYMIHDPATPGLPTGPQAAKQLAQTYRTAFPDLRITIEDQSAEGDKVVTRWRGRGTHKGNLAGISPTNKVATAMGTTIDRVANGMVQETWTNWDALGLFQQLGVVRPPGAMG